MSGSVDHGCVLRRRRCQSRRERPWQSSDRRLTGRRGAGGSRARTASWMTRALRSAWAPWAAASGTLARELTTLRKASPRAWRAAGRCASPAATHARRARGAGRSGAPHPPQPLLTALPPDAGHALRGPQAGRQLRRLGRPLFRLRLHAGGCAEKGARAASAAAAEVGLLTAAAAQEDPWNAIASGALTGGFLQARLCHARPCASGADSLSAAPRPGVRGQVGCVRRHPAGWD